MQFKIRRFTAQRTLEADGKILFSHHLRTQAVINVGRAPTNHALSQTNEAGIKRIIHQIQSFNKLLSANHDLQEKIKQTSVEGLEQLERKFHYKWQQLQEIVKRRIDDVADQEAQAIKVMRLIRRHHLEVTMAQLSSHYHKVQQKRLADMEIFKMDLKAKFAEELHQKALEVEEYRLYYRIMEKQVEKRKADIAAAEVASARAKTDAMDLISKKLMESFAQQVDISTVAKVINLEVIKQTLADIINERDGLQTSVEHLQQETEKQEVSLRLLEYHIDRTMQDIMSANDTFKTYESQLRHSIHGVTSERDKVHDAKMHSLAQLNDKANVVPTKVILQEELSQLKQECEDLLETGKVLRARGRFRAAQWMKKLSVLENATKELRKEMFRRTYSQKIARKATGMQAKNPVILKGPISKDAAEEYIENMGAKILLPKAKPGKVFGTPEKAKLRLMDKQREIKFVSGAESLEEVLRKGETKKDGKDLVALFSQESDIDKLVKEIEHLEMHGESHRQSAMEDADVSDDAEGARRVTLVNPFLPTTELTESLVMLAAIEKDFENKKRDKRSSKRLSKKFTAVQPFSGLRNTPNEPKKRKHPTKPNKRK
ncbi:uncharacterized protein LOC129585840 [Paramacrobiotus metropolitanus]|uniref:uncharacterized protein LOC129585840 n=1 Tax=Paramacrobiotus metropolitanus TaxID=2943436 RepID=UPI002445A6C9|nr:uncharacterized protein LOC129585840 [Paramacrobiotus metropolitanus]